MKPGDLLGVSGSDGRQAASLSQASLREDFIALEASNRALHPDNRGFFDPNEFGWVTEVEARWLKIRRELDQLLGSVDALPNFQDLQADQKELTTDDAWKVFPFHAYGAPYEPNLKRCPETAAALRLIPGMTSAMFSVLRGPKALPPHRGPFNGVLRYHLALTVPGDPERCRIRVGDSWRSWLEGKSLIFDDTFEHEVMNELPGARAVLFVDFLRPAPPHLSQLNRDTVRAIGGSPAIQDLLKNLARWNVDFETAAPKHPSEAALPVFAQQSRASQAHSEDWPRVVGKVESRSVRDISPAAFRSQDSNRVPHPLLVRGDASLARLAALWTDEFLLKKMGDVRVMLYVSADGTFPGGEGPHDPSRYRVLEMPFSECLARITGKRWSPLVWPGEKYYLYQCPTQLFGSLMVDYVQPAYVPGDQALNSNVWLSGASAITPLHYDISDNILTQARGRKSVLLWSPEQYPLLYLRPLGEVHSRQSRVNLARRDPDSFPAFLRAEALHCELSPGDLLFIPACWAHHIETLETSISINHAWSTDELTRVASATLQILNSPRSDLQLMAKHLIEQRCEATRPQPRTLGTDSTGKQHGR